MPWDLLIRGGDVVTPDGVRRLDVAVEDGTIVELAAEVAGDARETIDAAGLHVFPGLIDPHVHFNEPGRTEWEGFASGSSALAAGGGTCFFDMPLNSSPPTLDGPSFDLKRAAAEANSRTDFALWGGLTPGNLDRMEELAERGVVGFKAFMSNSGIEDFPAVDDYTLYRGMEIAAGLRLVVAVHAENDAITSGMAARAVREGRRTSGDYLRSRPSFAEREAIQRAVLFADELRCDLHVVHVSTANGVNAVRFGRDVADWAEDGARECRVSCETCPHYLLLDETAVEQIGAAAKCAPPLRTPQESQLLRRALLEGEIDFVGSDHSPAPASMKQGPDFFEVWGGIAGVQSTLSALLSLQPRLRLEDVGRYVAHNVARRFGIASKGAAATGYDADLTLVDIGTSYTLTRDMLLDRHKLSPYVGRTFRGVVKRTIVRGRTVFRDGRIVAGDFRGRLVTPKRGAARA